MEKTACSQRVRERSWQPLTAVVAYLGLDGDVQRGSRWLGTQRRRAEGTREMEERVVLSHDSDCGLGGGDRGRSRGVETLAAIKDDNVVGGARRYSSRNLGRCGSSLARAMSIYFLAGPLNYRRIQLTRYSDSENLIAAQHQGYFRGAK